MSGQIAILRQCVRCLHHLSIDDFLPNAHMCQTCVNSGHDGKGRPTTRLALTRGMVITDKGKQALADMAAEEAAAA